jgi:hypothetical protein
MSCGWGDWGGPEANCSLIEPFKRVNQLDADALCDSCSDTVGWLCGLSKNVCLDADKNVVEFMILTCDEVDTSYY